MDASIASLQTRPYSSFPIHYRLFSFLIPLLSIFYIIGEHIFPKIGILQSKLLGNLEAKSEIQNN